MSLPTPEPALVIPYAYLWRHEHRKGQEEGREVRPRVIVLAVQSAKGGASRVTVAPICYTPLAKDGEAIKVPPRVRQALGLDDDRSWIVLDEVNQFAWPGYDILPVPGSKDRFAFGFIPPGSTIPLSPASSSWPLRGTLPKYRAIRGCTDALKRPASTMLTGPQVAGLCDDQERPNAL